jgi:excisionase family DNA binding protein
MINQSSATNNVVHNHLSSALLTDALKDFIRAEIADVLDDRPPEILSRQQVAGMLKISMPTLLKWTRSGVLPSLKVDRSVRFYRRDIDNLLQSKGQSLC